MRYSRRTVYDREIELMVVALCKRLCLGCIMTNRVEITLLRGNVRKHGVQIMVMRDRPPLDRLRRSFDGLFQGFFNESELAPCPKRQGSSIALIALPFIRRSRDGDHVVDRFVAIRFGFFDIATQRVDARAQRDRESGRADAFARIAALEIAPALFDLEHLVPVVQSKPALGLDAHREGQ